MISDMSTSKYEPVYFSRAHAWKNDINHTDERYVRLTKDMEIFDKEWSHFLDLMRSKKVDEMAVRQGLIIWLNTKAKIDCELEDFDKKVRKDTDAYLRENTGPVLG